jgi:hypothetical protein
MASWLWHDGNVHPGVQLAAFQEESYDGKNAPGATRDELALDYVARASLAWGSPGHSFELGVGGSLRLLSELPLTPPSRYWAGTIDATLDHTFAAGGGVRLWVESFVGTNSSAFDTTPETTGDPEIAAVRGLLGWRVGGVEKGEWYLEPFLLASMLDPNLANANDGVWEVAGGLGFGAWKRWKLQVQYEVWRKSDLTPVLTAGGGDLADHNAVVVQLGAAF